MKRVIFLLTLVGLALAIVVPLVTSAAGPEWVVVNSGETLASIAARYGIAVDALMRANNLPNESFVYSGQRLLIPDPLMRFSEPPVQSPPQAAPQTAPQVTQVLQPQPASAVYYTVRPGDTLAGIAARNGVSASAIAQANNLTNWNTVWYGQRLIIPGADMPAPKPPAPEKLVVIAAPPENAPTEGKWIDVNVSNQTIVAYEGRIVVRAVRVSTGLPRTPTVLGTYKILSKYPAVHMIGGTPGIDYYDLPNVPYTMFFYQGYAIHGAYWHTNFGRPQSHGCVNLPTDEAKWFYEWAPVGTIVVSHN